MGRAEEGPSVSTSEQPVLAQVFRETAWLRGLLGISRWLSRHVVSAAGQPAAITLLAAGSVRFTWLLILKNI